MRRDMRRCVKLFKTETCHVYDNGRVNVQKAQQLFIVSLFGSILFVTKVFFNPPWDNLLIVVQAVLLALAAFFIRTLGATYVGIVGGILTSLARPALGPLTFLFTFLFGFLVDITFHIFKVTSSSAEVKRDRTVLAMALNTALIAFLSYYITTLLFEWLPLDAVWAALMVFLGAGSGISAGYAAAYLWNKYLKNVRSLT
ncbi:MAG: hypothetical protein QW674_04305 [Candidatus Bathyarchaeia archaeon]